MSLTPGQSQEIYTPVEVFYSYAHEDEGLRRQLEKHLSLLHRQGVVSSWHGRQVVAGQDWAKVIDTHLETASLILLLISADFLASDYCYGMEMKRALERHQANEARVIPILLRPVAWRDAPFSKLQVLPSDGIPVTSRRWHSLDEAWYNVIQGIRVVLQERKPTALSTLRTSFPRIWNIPYPRNTFFTGRDELLTHLSTALAAGQATALSQPQAICGLGGVGKTQIAVEYAYRYCQNYQTVFWVQSETRESLVLGYLAIAELLDLPEKDEQDQDLLIKVVMQWLANNTSWLLILDNADDLAMVRGFLPSVFGGHMLLTTRAQSLGRLGRSIEVEIMQQDVGALFLLRRASLIAADALLADADTADVAAAREICKELGGLPLALDQAGTFIEETQCSLLDYQQNYRTRRMQFLEQRGAMVVDHPESVATTWSLSFEKIERISPAAAELLRFCAFLAPDPIPETLFTRSAPYLGPVLSSVSADEFLLDKAIAALRAFSLVKRNIDRQTISIHPLVQAVIRDTMSEESQIEWAQRVIRAVHFALPKSDFVQEKQYQWYLSQVQTCATLIERYNLTLPEGLKLLNQASHFFLKNAQYEEAENLLPRALAISEAILGLTHPDTATSLNDLATLYQIQGKYAQAESLYLQALAIHEHQVGSNQPNIAVSLHNLATLYANQGKYEQAERLYQQTLAIAEQQLGMQHPDTAARLNNLAALYKRQGNYTKAEPLYLRALAISEQQLGNEHPDTATYLSNLAELYQIQGNYTKAEPLYLRALAISEQQLGNEHPDTASSLNNLASLYREQGKYAEAEPLYLRALAISERQLGAEHPDTATSLNNLAGLYYRQGRYEDTERLFQRALLISEKQLGASHPDTASSLNNLASFYAEQGKYAEAEPLLQRAFVIWEQSLGPEHPQVAYPLNNLGDLYRDQGKYAEAEPLLQRALHIWEQQLGPDHPQVAYPLNNLANLYREQGKYAEAEPLFQRALHIWEQQLGPEHPETAETLHDLATLREQQGQQKAALALYQRALAIREQALGLEHPRTRATRERLTALRERGGHEADAPPEEHISPEQGGQST